MSPDKIDPPPTQHTLLSLQIPGPLLILKTHFFLITDLGIHVRFIYRLLCSILTLLGC